LWISCWLPLTLHGAIPGTNAIRGNALAVSINNVKTGLFDVKTMTPGYLKNEL
jgi:hypothetical protein